MKSILSVLACASVAAATPLSTVLAATNSTTMMLGMINSVPGLMPQLEALRNITILIPEDDAIKKLDMMKASGNATSKAAFVAALLSYHVLVGEISAAQIMNSMQPLFAHTDLDNPNFEMVPGGQFVEATAKTKFVNVMTSMTHSTLMTHPTMMTQVTHPTAATVPSMMSKLASTITDTLHTTSTVVVAPSHPSSSALVARSDVSSVGAAPGLATTSHSVSVVMPSSATTSHSISTVVPSISHPATTSMITKAVTTMTTSHLTAATSHATTMASKVAHVEIEFISGLDMRSEVRIADIPFDGGLIHVIDKVLTIPKDIETTCLHDKLVAFAGALIFSDLVNTIQGMDNLTVFAPSDNAFMAVGSVLAGMSAATLKSVLTYHVVKDEVLFSTTLINDSKLTTLNGAVLTVHKEGNATFVNNAKIVKPNNLVKNGVVHIIDEVLNPSNTTAMPSATAKSGMPEFSGASMMSVMPFTSGLMPTMTKSNTAMNTAAHATTASRVSGGALTMMTPTTTGPLMQTHNAAALVRPGQLLGAVAVGAAFLL